MPVSYLPQRHIEYIRYSIEKITMTIDVVILALEILITYTIDFRCEEKTLNMYLKHKLTEKIISSSTRRIHTLRIKNSTENVKYGS